MGAAELSSVLRQNVHSDSQNRTNSSGQNFDGTCRITLASSAYSQDAND